MQMSDLPRSCKGSAARKRETPVRQTRLVARIRTVRETRKASPMNEISEERAIHMLAACDEEDSQWYDHAIDESHPTIPISTHDVRALIASHRALAAAKEEGERLRGELQALRAERGYHCNPLFPGDPSMCFGDEQTCRCLKEGEQSKAARAAGG